MFWVILLFSGKSNLACLNEGGPNVPIELFEKAKPSFGIPKLFLSNILLSFSS